MKLAISSLAIAAVAVVALLAWPRGDAAPPVAALPIVAPAATEPAEPAAANAAPAPQREQVDAGDTATELSGSIRDDAENPIAGAFVRVFASPKVAGAAPLADVRSEADGRFRVPLARAWPTTLTLEVEAIGHVPQSREAAKPAQRVDVMLSRLVVLHGRVLAHGTDAPLANAAVHVGEERVATDSAGRYELTVAMTRGAAYVIARHAGYLDDGRSIRVNGRERTEVDFVLQPEVMLTVQVVDAHTCEPIAGAEVRRQRDVDEGAARTDEGAARTDEHGRASFAVGEGQQLSRTVRAPGYGDTVWSWKVRDATSITPRLPMVRRATIEGRVTDTDGKAIEGATVIAQQLDAGETREVPPPPGESWAPGMLLLLGGDRNTRSDAQGAFAFDAIPGGPAYVVTASGADHVRGKSAPVTVDQPGARTWVELRLERGATVHGVVRKDGAAVPHCVVSWDAASRPALGGRVLCTDTGEYTLHGVAPGEVHLRVDSLGSGTLRTGSVRVESGQTLRHDFVWEDKVAAITGRITSSDGQPLADVPVQALSDGDHTHVRTARSEADGRYSLPCVAGATYLVSAFRVVHEERASVAAGTNDVDFVLPELGELRLQLLDSATREPVRVTSGVDFWSLAWRERGSGNFLRVHEKIDANGRVELRVPIGAVDVSVWLADFGYVPRTVLGLPVTTDPRPAPIPIELTRGAELTIELSAETPLPRDVASKHLVFCVDERESALLRGPFAEQGAECNHQINDIKMWLGEPSLTHRLVQFDFTTNAAMKGLAPGRHWLRVFPDDIVFEPESFDVPAPGGKVVVRWQRR